MELINVLIWIMPLITIRSKITKLLVVGYDFFSLMGRYVL